MTTRARTVVVVSFLFSIISALGGCEKKPDAVKRGEYLARIGGCHDCHTPKILAAGAAPALDTSRLLSGHPENVPYPTWMSQDPNEANALVLTTPMLTAWAGPWGVSFAVNLTPDKATGLGEWSEETFIRALRTGKHQGQANGRDILPPMPWSDYKDATDEDLKAIWAYLRSIPAVTNRVPSPLSPGSQPPKS
jgi:mono/diheme cytochrome c family protein